MQEVMLKDNASEGRKKAGRTGGGSASQIIHGTSYKTFFIGSQEVYHPAYSSVFPQISDHLDKKIDSRNRTP
jgi:hypothetical protein